MHQREKTNQMNTRNDLKKHMITYLQQHTYKNGDYLHGFQVYTPINHLHSHNSILQAQKKINDNSRHWPYFSFKKAIRYILHTEWYLQEDKHNCAYHSSTT